MVRLIRFIQYGNPILQMVYGVLFLALGVLGLVITIAQARGASEMVAVALLLLIGIALLGIGISRQIKKGQAPTHATQAPTSQNPYQQNP